MCVCVLCMCVCVCVCERDRELYLQRRSVLEGQVQDLVTSKYVMWWHAGTKRSKFKSEPAEVKH